MQTRQQIALTACIAALVFTGCSNNPPSYPATASAPSATYVGRVESIEVVPAQSSSSGPGLGAIGGAVAGGLLGHQVGSGRGNTAATIGGAVAGGVVGNEVEKNVRGGNNAGQAYRLTVRLDDGSTQVVTQPSQENIRVGDRVRIANGRATRY